MHIKNPLCPKCKQPAIGTGESVLGTALIHLELRDDGTADAEYSGTTDMNWDSQETLDGPGGHQLVCECGNTWESPIDWEKPVVVVAAEIADAFGMRGLPNTVVVEPPGSPPEDPTVACPACDQQIHLRSNGLLYAHNAPGWTKGSKERTERGEIVTPTPCPGGGLLPAPKVDLADTIGSTAPPARYNRDGERECIDLMRDLLGDEGFIAYCRGQVLKYTYRAGAKDLAEQDIEKARFYQKMALHVLDPATNDDPRSYRAAHQPYVSQPFDMRGRHELLQTSLPDLDDSVPYWRGHGDYVDGVPRGLVPDELNTLGKTMWLRGWDAAKKEDDEEPDTEAAMQAGMEHGTQGYNEARGYDTSEPEPCGHHCSADCPRCGVE